MKRVGLWLIVVAAVALSGCYLLAPAGGAQVNKVTVDPSYLTVGPGEQVTVNVTTDPPDVRKCHVGDQG